MLKVDIKKKLGHFHLEAAFEAESGVTGLLGASGCGKSMTLKCIAGIEKPDSGHIELNGVTLFDSRRRIHLTPQAREVGYLFQNYALFPNMTVLQNILCGLHKEKRGEIRSSILNQTVARLSLEGLLNHKPFQLSGGQQQRVALARILVSKPKLLMLDEPFSALDSHLREKLQMEMKSFLSLYNGPSLMVTHNRDEAYRLCHNLSLMKSGRVLETRPTKALFADPGSIETARMMGYKNISKAVKTGDFELLAVDWGIRLTTQTLIRENLSAVCVAAHAFSEDAELNRYTVRLEEAIEAPFEFTLPFRFESQPVSSKALVWRMHKERRPADPVIEIGISPENVLALYES